MIKTLEQMVVVLEGLGYRVELHDAKAACLIMDVESRKFVTILTIDDKNMLHVNCQVARVGNMKEGEELSFMGACLAINARISPYAVAMITDSNDPNDDEEEEWPIVLTDSIPLADLSPEELESAVNSLRAALLNVIPILDTFCSVE